MTAGDGISSKRTTIYDLARIVGTSPTAVSSVLNGSWKKRRISQKLADRVLSAAEENGYALNIQASVLRREKSNIVGMIIPKYDNRFFGAIAERFEEAARAEGLFPVITCTQRDPDLEVEAVRGLLSYQVDCLVACGATNPRQLARRRPTHAAQHRLESGMEGSRAELAEPSQRIIDGQALGRPGISVGIDCCRPRCQECFLRNRGEMSTTAMVQHAP